MKWTISGQNVDELHDFEDSTTSVDIAARVPMLKSCDDEEFARFEVENVFMLQTLQSVKHCVTIYDIKLYLFKVIKKSSKLNIQTEAILGTTTLFNREML